MDSILANFQKPLQKFYFDQDHNDQSPPPPPPPPPPPKLSIFKTDSSFQKVCLHTLSPLRVLQTDLILFLLNHFQLFVLTVLISLLD